MTTQTSKLSESVARALQFLDGIPNIAVITLVIVISGLFTEVTSNLSTASIFMPVLDSVVSFVYLVLSLKLLLINRHDHLIFILLF